MRIITRIILLMILCISCADNSQKISESLSDDKNNDSLIDRLKNQFDLPEKDNLVIEENLEDELSKTFEKAIINFPKDSNSLYRFYYKTFPAKNREDYERHIKRIDKLNNSEIIETYHQVDNHLRNILNEVIITNSINCTQADSIAKLYSFYDKYTGEGLFSQVLTGEDNYKLVWKSFSKMIENSVRDTCYIAYLIYLDNHIRTNVELGEAMSDFIVRAIQNNPKGFLEMYLSRTEKKRFDFSRYISVYDEPDTILIKIYKNISINSDNDKYIKASNELIDNINEMYK